ncbi:matrixin family metalloprotease [Paenibacillus sp. 1001270B_150601_E10]|uniref:matrixin family metalloprotease n=1 Tax=Paenibacillus sp. 1001270B_150601_E10 TaxID=2787079 RepID=UPI003B6413E4
MNSYHTETFNNSSALKSVLAHELGHVLGLAHSNVLFSLMNPEIWGLTGRYGFYGITESVNDDLDGATSIYK